MSGLVDRAMDAQIDLNRLCQRPVYLAHVYAYLDNSNADLSEAERKDSEHIANHAELIVGSLALATGVGECYAISPEISEMLMEAAPSMPTGDWTLEHHDLPSPDGFAWLDGGMVITDAQGEAEVAVAIAWATGTQDGHEIGTAKHSGVAITLLTTPFDKRDEWHDRLSVQPGDPGYECLTFAFSATATWMYGTAMTEHADEQGAEWVKFLAALWRFVKEPYVEQREDVPSRPALKRQRRSGVAKPRVNVIRLRKRASTKSEPGDGEAHYSHRFPVKGHWRNQWYASQGVHRPRWIPSYIKGPEDAPLRIHDRAFVVDR